MSKKIVIIKGFIAFWAFFFPLILMGQTVHVLMPVYNSTPYLNKSLDSIFMQTYDDIRLIAYNDGSTDDSVSILHQYHNRHPRKMILFGTNDNNGTAFARESLLKKSFETDPDAMILWLDSDDCYTDNSFVEIFVQQMMRTGAEICLFNFDLILEDQEQKSNLNGLNEEQLGHARVLDKIWNHPKQTLSPNKIDNIMDISSLGGTKGYHKIHWPTPLNAPYEDFVYMAALLRANQITALPSSYKPIQYLRRSNSITGHRTAKTFTAVADQLERFVHEVSPENRKLHKDKIVSFLTRKISQYETLLQKFVDSKDHPDITEKTLFEYRTKTSKLVSFSNTCP